MRRLQNAADREAIGQGKRRILFMSIKEDNSRPLILSKPTFAALDEIGEWTNVEAISGRMTLDRETGEWRDDS